MTKMRWLLLLSLGFLVLLSQKPSSNPNPHLLGFKLAMSREACGPTHAATFNEPMMVDIYYKIGADDWSFLETVGTDSFGVAYSYIPASRTQPSFARVDPQGPRSCSKVWQFGPVNVEPKQKEHIR